MKISFAARPWMALFGLLLLPALAASEDKEAPDKEVAAKEAHEMSLGEGYLKLKVPGAWKSVEPKVRIIDYEFAAPASEGDEIDGRMTVMGAGGTVEANLDRWFAQFIQPDGSETKDKAKTEKKKISGQEVHLVDITGTYDDKPGPFVQKPGVKRPNFRMLAAIITTKDAGNYFLKFYGPAKTIGDHEKNFRSIVNSLQAKQGPVK